MSDCPNAEIRDLLPDLVHGTLAGADRARVEAHVASCADCTSEVALLRAARRALAVGAPAVDVASIVRAIPAPPVRTAAVPGVVSIDDARRARRASRFGGWQRAAAVLLVTAGATTVALMRSDSRAGSSGTPGSTTVVVAPKTTPVSSPAPTTDESTVAVARGTADGGSASRDAGLSIAAGVGDLSDDALVALLGDLDDLDAAPQTEPAALLPDMTGEDSE